MRGHGGGATVVVVVVGFGVSITGGFLGSRERGAAVDAGALGAGGAWVLDGGGGGTCCATVVEGATDGSCTVG